MLRTKWFIGAAALVALVVAAGSASARPLSVEVWTDRGDDHVYNPGDAMQVRAKSNDDAYLLVYEIDSEGIVKVLFPFRRAAGMVEGKSTLMLPPEDSDFELAVESATGLGYIVAIASRRPFGELPWYLRQYDPQAASLGYEGAQGDVEGFDDEGKVMGDPTVAIERIRVAVLGTDTSPEDFATAYTTYYVGHEVRYPRYLCNDCHQPNHWGWWDGYDPYFTTCSVIDFRVNWNWCWGPCMWSAHTPYYYYVVRPDCPPYYYPYYANNTRWSSWGGTTQWNDLWGGPLTRYKSAPPVGYVPPPTKSGDYPRTTPPGWVATKTAGAGYAPAGKSGYGGGKTAPGGSAYKPGAGTPQKPSGYDKGGAPASRGGKGGPAFEPPKQATPKSDRPKYEQPKDNQPKGDQGGDRSKGDQGNSGSQKGSQPKYDTPPKAGPQKGGDAPKYSPSSGKSGSMRTLGAYRPKSEGSGSRTTLEKPQQGYRSRPGDAQPLDRQSYGSRTGGGNALSRYEKSRSGGGSPARYEQSRPGGAPVAYERSRPGNGSPARYEQSRSGGGSPAKYQQSQPSRASNSSQGQYSAPARSSGGSGEAPARQSHGGGGGGGGGGRTKGR